MSTFRLLAISSLLFGLGACSTTPYLDQHFGDTVKMSQAMQTINPDASQNTDPVKMDGVSAAYTMQNYHDAAKSPPAPVNVFNIGVGTSSK